MRTFYLMNETGQRVPLNNEDGIMFYGPEGLGIEYSNEFGGMGDGFYYRIREEVAQASPGGTLLFTNDKYSPYARFQSFVDWCMRSKELFLIYDPFGIPTESSHEDYPDYELEAF